MSLFVDGGKLPTALTENQSLVYEAAVRKVRLTWYDVRNHVTTETGEYWSSDKCSRYLRQLAKLGLLEKLPRIAFSWGAQAYRLTTTEPPSP